MENRRPISTGYDSVVSRGEGDVSGRVAMGTDRSSLTVQPPGVVDRFRDRDEPSVRRCLAERWLVPHAFGSPETTGGGRFRMEFFAQGKA